jgi:hypothetical protein
MEPLGWIAVGLVVAFVVDRLALAAEARGWIRWRRAPPSSTSVGTAMLSVQALFEPDREHVVQERLDEESRIDVAEDADPVGTPDAGPGRGPSRDDAARGGAAPDDGASA